MNTKGTGSSRKSASCLRLRCVNSRALGVALVILVGAAARVEAQSFQGLGALNGKGMSYALSVSDDGLVIVGTNAGENQEAFRWIESDGIRRLGTGVATDVSGQIMVGCFACDASLNGGNPARWVSMDQMHTEADVIGVFETVSADGTIAAGYTSAGRAVRWTASEGIVDIGLLPGGFVGGGVFARPTAMSDDGTVIVGEGRGGLGSLAVRWTETDGAVALEGMDGQRLQGRATGTSSDGSIVVGTAESGSGWKAFQWTLEDGVIFLDDLPAGISFSEALDVAADGSSVVGAVGEGLDREAFIWQPDRGMMRLQEMLTNHFDLDLSGWDLAEATGVSADGRAIVGNSPQGAWVARLPMNGDANGDGSVDSRDLNTVALNWRQEVSGWSNGDFDHSGLVDARDLNLLASNWRRQNNNPVSAVPEPHAALLATLAICATLALGVRRRRKS